MDYEKKYKEALERARKLYNEAKILDYTQDMEDYETIFPELKESEDERIRKEIFHFVLENTLSTDMRQHRWLAWLEKQGLSTFDKCRQEGDRIVENPDGTHFNISQLERVAKVEPKFHEGDWITDGYVGGQITSIEDNYPCYKIADFMGGINTSIPFTLQDNYHLWTIADAKDGDVLTSINFHSNCTFIFKGLDNWKFDEPNGDRVVATGYCCLSASADKMEFGIQGPDCVETNTIKPATKIQRDLLFAKMNEAGYEWDDEKKELRKIEKQAPKTKWSEEDEIGSDATIELLEYFINYAPEFRKPTTRRSIDWLKSLKKRMEEQK